MTDWPDVQVCVVLPSGVATLPFDGGAITCRVTVGHLDAPGTGLIEEMTSGAEPVPWRSARVRDEALWSIETRLGVDEDVRRRLLKWVSASPFYTED